MKTLVKLLIIFITTHTFAECLLHKQRICLIELDSSHSAFRYLRTSCGQSCFHSEILKYNEPVQILTKEINRLDHKPLTRPV